MATGKLVERRAASRFTPYLAWAVPWFALFFFAATVRVGTVLWDPVYRWMFVQAMAFESLVGPSGRWATFGFVLAVYLVIGNVLWLTIENVTPLQIGSAWARSGLAWAVLQVLAMIAIFFST